MMFGFLTLIDSEVEMFHVCCAELVVNGGNLRIYACVNRNVAVYCASL